MSKTGIVNVRMVITEEKILSNIDKVQKLINPNAKKQIIQLQEDAYFKDLIESIKAYLTEYPKKKNFPATVYKAAYGLVETATTQFEQNTKKIEELIRQREANIKLAGKLRNASDSAQQRIKGWKEQVKEIEQEFSEDIVEALTVMGKTKDKEAENYKDAEKLIKARINNLEANLHIEIDMERIEDRSKALSYIGIEIADALKEIPAPQEEVEETIIEEAQTIEEEIKAYQEATTIKAKPTLWQRIKNSKVGRAVSFVMKIRIRIEVPSNALPEGRGEE